MKAYFEHRDLAMTFNEMRRGAPIWSLANEVKKWREAMGWAIKAAKVPKFDGPVGITVHHLRKTRSAMPDCVAPVIAQKASIDALVDMGRIPEDGPEIVRWVLFLAPEVKGYHGVGIEVEEL